MAFLESPRFPDDIALGARGGPEFVTDIETLFSGSEAGNINRDQGLGRWVVGHVAKPLTAFAELEKFFRAVRGRGHRWRFKDHRDFTATTAEGVVTLISGDTYQMWKRYQPVGSALFEDYKVVKPVSPTVSVTGGGVYTVAYTTGIITRVSGAVPTGWSGEFDKPCRFGSDHMADAQIVDRQGGSGPLLCVWDSIEIIEVLNP